MVIGSMGAGRQVQVTVQIHASISETEPCFRDHGHLVALWIQLGDTAVSADVDVVAGRFYEDTGGPCSLGLGAQKCGS